MTATPSFLIDGEQACPGTDRFARALATAYARRGRPQCLCSASRPPMCIAKVGPQFILRRMPGTGGDHHGRCRSWTGDVGHVGSRRRSSPPPHLPPESDPNDPGGRPIATSTRPASDRVAPGQPLWSAQDLLLHLWRVAALTDWRPHTEGQRSWDSVRRRLLDAATNLPVDGRMLADRLYIPEPFDLAQVTEIYARRRIRWSEIRHLCSRASCPAYILAEMKELRKLERGDSVALRHIPDRRLEVDRASAPAPEMLDMTARRHPRVAHTIVLIAVDLADRAWHWRHENAVLLVDSLWRPLVTPQRATPAA